MESFIAALWLIGTLLIIIAGLAVVAVSAHLLWGAGCWIIARIRGVAASVEVPLGVLSVAAILALMGCRDPETERVAVARERMAEIQRGHLQRDIDYIWRMKVVRVCGEKQRQYVLKGTDGRLWLSDYTNPGQRWSDYDYQVDARPLEMLDPIEAKDPKEVCN
jgi:hypothetical protein